MLISTLVGFIFCPREAKLQPLATRNAARKYLFEREETAILTGIYLLCMRIVVVCRVFYVVEGNVQGAHFSGKLEKSNGAK